MRVPREQLYEEVWADPATTVAERYGVTSTLIARVCDQLRVPRPGRDHWARIAAGKEPHPRPTLPAARPGDVIEWTRDRNVYARREPMPTPVAPDLNSVAKPVRPLHMHPLTMGAFEVFSDGRLSDSGYLKPKKGLVVDVYASKDGLRRALRLAERLYLALEAEGFGVSIAPAVHGLRRGDLDHRAQTGRTTNYGEVWSPNRPTIVMVGTVAIGLTVHEISEAAEVRYQGGAWTRVTSRQPRPSDGYSWTTTRDLPTGKFCIRAYSPYYLAEWEKRWTEERRGELKQRLPEILKAIVDAAPTIAKLYEEGERQEALRRKQEEEAERQQRRERDAQLRAESLEKSRDQLLEIVRAWTVATQIDAFFKEAIERSSDANDSEALRGRLAEARAMLGGVDPVEHFSRWKSPEERCAEERSRSPYYY
jgi:hypothetical protein